MSNGLASSIAILLSGESNTSYLGLPLPAPLPGAPGCQVFVAWQALDSVLTDAQGSASSSITVPNNASLVGLELFHQWALIDPTANALGIVTSDAGAATIGL